MHLWPSVPSPSSLSLLVQAEHDCWPYRLHMRFGIEEVPPELLQRAAGSTTTVVRGDAPCEAIDVFFGSRWSNAAALVTTTGASTGYYRAVLVTVGKKYYDVRVPIRARWLTTNVEEEVEVQGVLGAAVWSPVSEKVGLVLSPTGEKWTICDLVAKGLAFWGHEVPEGLCAALEAEFAVPWGWGAKATPGTTPGSHACATAPRRCPHTMIDVWGWGRRGPWSSGAGAAKASPPRPPPPRFFCVCFLLCKLQVAGVGRHI